MVQKKLKQMGAFALAVTMLIGAVQLPVKAEGESNVIAKGDNLTLPSAGDGETVRFCADYEQIIDEDGTVYTPLEDKTVTGFFETTSGETVTKTSESTYTVQGEYKADPNANPKPAVIPELQEWHGREGKFVVSVASKVVISDNSLLDMAKIFQEDYRDITGMELKEIKTGTKADAKPCDFYFGLTEEKNGLGKEGYFMDIDDEVSVEAEDTVGAYYATRTILQILKTSGSMPKGLIRDYPKYEVRAFLLDVGRKAFSMDTVKEFVKNMSWYKMNSFQLHLNDNLIFIEDHKLPTDTPSNVDQANRLKAIEQSYEAFRLESDKKNDETGKTLTAQDMYYTKDEVRSLIQDSRIIGIDVVPELDMPAHALSFTKTFPEYMSEKDSTSWGTFKYTFDELDLSAAKYDQTIAFAKRIWEEYIGGENPVFDEKTTLHIGTDEHHGVEGNEGFRKFSRDLINYIQDSGRNVRMWGSLSNKGGINAEPKVPSENVQLNLWNTTYANPSDMYDAGFDIINTSCHDGLYIVPRGTGARGTNYEDYLDTAHIYNSWSPNRFSNKNYTIPAGDDQMLGGCYAIWHDYIDTRANGISEYDSFDRFFEALPYMSAKLWGDARDREYADFTRLANGTGTAPGTTVRGELDYLTSTIAEYSFDETLSKDSGINGFDLKTSKNAELKKLSDGNALKLNGGESYIETPDNLDLIGDSAVLKMRVKMDENAVFDIEEDEAYEQILCESKEKFGTDDTYGRYAFKAVQKRTGKVGFSREGYDYSFDYTLPKGEWVDLEFRSGQQNVALYVNGELADDDPDIYYFNHPDVNKSQYLKDTDRLAQVSTMLVPFGRIGSKTSSFWGEIDSVTVTAGNATAAQENIIPHSEMTATSCSVAATQGNEGPVNFAIDDNDDTYWHSDWKNDSSITADHPHWFKVELNSAKTITKLTCLPRKTGDGGRITKYSIDVEEVNPNGTTTTKTVVQEETWENTPDLKTAEFTPVKAKSVTLKILDSPEDNVGKHATIAELDLYESLNTKSDLQEAVADAKSDAYQRNDYTDQSWYVFQKAKEKAETILNYENSTEKDYSLAYQNLSQASDALIKLNTFMTKPLQNRYAISSSLPEAEEQLNVLEEGTAAFAALQAAIQAAKNALEQEDGSGQTDLSEVLSNLQDASNVDKVFTKTKESLAEAITEAKKKLLDTTGFTEASVNKLQTAVTEAEKILKKEDVSIKELEDQINSLNNISLEKDTINTPSGNGGTADGLKDNDPFEKDGMKYQVVSASALTAKLVKGTDTAKPTIDTVSYDGKTYKIVEIGAAAFSGCKKKLKKVTIGPNVAVIGKNAFKGCKKLANVVIKNNSKLTKVGGGAFKKTSSKIKVKLPKNLKKNKKLKKQLKKAGIKKGL